MLLVERAEISNSWLNDKVSVKPEKEVNPQAGVGELILRTQRLVKPC